MSAEVLAVLGVAVSLAYANGANDVSKGVATLVGSGVSDYRRAILWGTLWTAAGGLLGAVFAGAMLSTFGSGLFAPGITPTFVAAVAALGGAGAWVLIATRAALPVSTTHALIGSLVGVSALAYGIDGVRWAAVGSKVFLPLLLSPLIALALTAALARAMRPRRPGPVADCACVAVEPVAEPALVGVAQVALRTRVAPAETCAVEEPVAVRLTLSHLHWLTSGATSLARGMNDAPKMVALGLAAAALGASGGISVAWLYVLVTAGMVAGSLVGGRRVTRVLAEDVTTMDHREGFAANLVAAALVTTGAVHGLPMSTTHVATGGIFGAGAQRGTLDRRALRGILLAWIITLPAAAALGCGLYLVASRFG